jgi:hypothetical protein
VTLRRTTAQSLADSRISPSLQRRGGVYGERRICTASNGCADGVRGCHTQRRTVDEARCRIRKALELFVDNARRAPIVDDVNLPSAATRAIQAYTTLRKRADEEDRPAARAARRAVRVLRTGRLKMSARDAARLLGLLHQRVHQLSESDA